MNMQSDRDCGPCAISNLVEILTGYPSAVAYQQIISSHGFPNRNDIRDDLWDSPSRHLRVIEAITGKKAGLIPDPLIVPSVVLLRLSLTCWHWVTVKGCPGHGSPVVWHDGKKERVCTFEERFPGCRVVLAYTLGGVIPLPWYFRLWGWLASWVVG